MDKKVKILVCAHKEVDLPPHPYFFPIHGGAALSSVDLPYIRDDTGDNISDKNKNYCELTAHYWFWKNSKSDIVGLNHYRRFFDFGYMNALFLPERKFMEINEFLNQPYRFPDNLTSLLDKYDIILPPKRNWPYKIVTQYAIFHIINDMNILRDVMRDVHPDYLSAFDSLLYHQNAYSQFNMFITKWEVFDAYSKWLFELLFEVEKRVKLSSYVDQARVFGYMSERLLNVYVMKNGLKALHVPVVTAVTESEMGERITGLRYRLRYVKNYLIFKLFKI
ncbi:uncharacterized protein DUF4422 [Bacteroides heparinolyticus]|uniref:Uncharacterized protein DUF4422 n=1 Tax=Prevotella heparinolytica TaxID=28113 RepID=A0A4R2M474_9BACE|nr:DUF4422 domain-containing protein [Bacteroides heparinolyticus]TCO89990.1 uncharacterized protein DUF4422 [Bacteroides heparinolyticus]